MVIKAATVVSARIIDGADPGFNGLLVRPECRSGTVTSLYPKTINYSTVEINLTELR